MEHRWPDLFIVGAGKAGTTSLHRYLDQHPAITMSSTKETHFFDETWPRTVDDSHAFRQACQAYLDGFERSPATEVMGESTPSYLHEASVPARIAKVCPGARFIASLRDPIERAYSDHWMLVRLGEEERNFAEVIEKELTGGREAEYHILRGRYDEHVGRYFDTFGREHVLILLFEDIKQDARAVLDRIARFVDVDPAGMDAVDTETVHNPGGQPKNPLASWLLTDERVHRLARRVVPERLRIWLGEEVLLEKRERPPLDQDTIDRLVEVFEPTVSRLEDLLDRELPELRVSWDAGK